MWDYHWRAQGTDHPGGNYLGGLDVVVVTEAAFERGHRAQQLRFSLRYDHRRPPLAGTEVLRQRAVISPVVIARAIELAPAFSGAIGVPDIGLDAEQIEELQMIGRLD